MKLLCVDAKSRNEAEEVSTIKVTHSPHQYHHHNSKIAAGSNKKLYYINDGQWRNSNSLPLHVGNQFLQPGFTSLELPSVYNWHACIENWTQTQRIGGWRLIKHPERIQVGGYGVHTE